MIFIYVACLIIGGVLLLGSLVLGAIHADADADHDVEVDASADVDGDVDASVDADHDADHDGDIDATGIWLPFLSLRFWVFTLSFFGLCGTLLTIIGTHSIITGGISVVIGLLCGTGAACVVHLLGKKDSSGDVATSSEFIGTVGEVLVTVKPGGRGKVRLSIRDTAVDVLATTSDDEILKSGQKVLVVEYEGDVASVTKAPLSDDAEGAI